MLSFDQLALAPNIAAFGEVNQGHPIPVYTPAIGNPFNLDGIFDNAYRSVDRIPELQINTSGPVLGVRMSDFPTGVTPAQQDRVMIRGDNYRVRDVQPDSHGGALLLLNEA